RCTISTAVEEIDDLLVRPIPRDIEPLRLLLSYAAAVRDLPASAPLDLGRLAATHVGDLIALALGATRDGVALANGRGVRAARLRAMKGDVVRNLGRDDLSVEELAARHRVTPRYVQMLFEQEGTTFTEFVQGRRLAVAHRMLSDPCLTGLSITSVAFDVGFGNLSYFNRLFRRRFGCTPSEMRRAAQDAQGDAVTPCPSRKPSAGTSDPAH